MLPRTRPSDSFSATLVNNCRVQARTEFWTNLNRKYITKEKSWPVTEIEIDGSGTLYRIKPNSFQRINVDKEKLKKGKKHG